MSLLLLRPYHSASKIIKSCQVDIFHSFRSIVTRTKSFHMITATSNLHRSRRLFSTEKKDNDQSSLQDHSTHSQPTTLLERTRVFFKKYGKVGLGVYVLVSSSTFLTIYSLVHAGVDVSKLIEWLGLEIPKWSEKASTLILTYTVYKILLPIRLMISAALTPYIMRYLKRINWMK